MSEGNESAPAVDSSFEWGRTSSKTLNYGDTIIVRGAACTCTEQGVRCDVGGHGFFISADRQTLF
ncbi:DUF6636 domain-containing protein [Nocardia sp. IBHARD005]|uniref:DUF6636 domain-containing protein n=1 Tax=Nocardia sp. IBHARD005 TaxID=3457765 RepID=UPI004058F664